MLSNATSSIQKRRTMHRRQNSTPTMYEAPAVRPLPAITPRNTPQHRRGMSLDQKPLLAPAPALSPVRMPTTPTLSSGLAFSSSQEDTVSISTNPGQPHTQHSMQVAQQQSLIAQPGYQYEQQQPLQTQSQPQPQPTTPTLQQPEPQFHSQPSPQPSERQVKELEDHIKSVYGAYGTVYVNILPTPITTPQKQPPLPPPDNVDIAPMPTLHEIGEYKLEPTPFSFEKPERDNGYESSYYSSEFSPQHSPYASPLQQTIPSFPNESFVGSVPRLDFQSGPSLFPTSEAADDNGQLSPNRSPSPQALSVEDLSLEGVIEDTGIAPEEVQAYISEQDPITHRWTCLYPDCKKDFGRRENIRSHVQTHLGDRQFKCIHCGKCFVRQHDLKRHAKIHSGDKPYKCPCGGGFARQDALTRHRQRGMCIGGFPNAVRREVRRGRPRKKRPNMDERVDKSFRTRNALQYASSSSSGGSPLEEMLSPADSFDGFDQVDTAQFTSLEGLGDGEALTSNPLNYDHSSPFEESSPAGPGALEHSSPFDEPPNSNTQSFETTLSSLATASKSHGFFATDKFETAHEATQPHQSPIEQFLEELERAVSAEPPSVGASSTHTPPHSPVDAKLPNGLPAPEEDEFTIDNPSTLSKVDQQTQDNMHSSPTLVSASEGRSSHPWSTPPSSPVVKDASFFDFEAAIATTYESTSSMAAMDVSMFCDVDGGDYFTNGHGDMFSSTQETKMTWLDEL